MNVKRSMNSDEVQHYLKQAADELVSLSRRLGEDGDPLTKEDKDAIRMALTATWFNSLMREIRFSFLDGSLKDMEFGLERLRQILSDFS